MRYELYKKYKEYTAYIIIDRGIITLKYFKGFKVIDISYREFPERNTEKLLHNLKGVGYKVIYQRQIA